MAFNSTPSSEHRLLRAIPPHLEISEAITELESSIPTPEGYVPGETSPVASTMNGRGSAISSNLANQLRMITQKLSEFVARSQSVADEEAEALDRERERNSRELENAAREVALAKLRAEESQLQLQNALEGVASQKTELDRERARIIELEKSIVEMRHQEEVHAKEIECMKTLLKKTEDSRAALKEQRDMLTVQLAADQGRLLSASSALEAAEKRAQRRRSPNFSEQLPPRASTPPVSICAVCLQTKQELAEVRSLNEKLKREAVTAQERATKERETSVANEQRLQEQISRMRKLVSQERGRAERLAYLHAALAADRRNTADLIATLQGQLNDLWDNQRQPRVKSPNVFLINSSSANEATNTETRSEADESETGEDTLVMGTSSQNLSRNQDNMEDQLQSEGPGGQAEEVRSRRRHSIPCSDVYRTAPTRITLAQQCNRQEQSTRTSFGSQ